MFTTKYFLLSILLLIFFYIDLLFLSHSLPKVYLLDIFFQCYIIVTRPQNFLEGNISWTLGNLSLEILDLSSNMFLGTIPHSLTTNDSSYSLVYLNLSNNNCEEKCSQENFDMPRLECLMAITLKESSHSLYQTTPPW